MADTTNSKILDEIWERMLPAGGFATRPGGQPRPDATAWAIIALQLNGIKPRHLHAARLSLSSSQLKDGRVVLSIKQPESFWPTPLAVLAWHGYPEFERNQSLAISFLLEMTGHHFKRGPDSLDGHDPSIRGWPWTEGTHSWVEPTTLAMIALRATGYIDNERISEGTRLLMDRQLSKGGWNYGNTTVFGTELAAMPESTGLALSALSGMVYRREISGSIAMLKASVNGLTTPFSLGWAILGLSAWGERPGDANFMVERCFRRQKRYGSYDTSLLSLLVLAQTAKGGLIRALA